MPAWGSRTRLSYAAAQAVIRSAMTVLTGWGVYGRRHLPRRGPVLLLCNHQSYLDPMVAGAPLPWECDFMARDSLFRQPHFGRLIRYFNAFPVRQEAADLQAIREALRRLRAGHSLCIFAEGSRTPDGRVHPLQRGLLVLAQRAGVPVLPAVIEGLYEVWPRSRRRPRPGPCWIEYGSMIDPPRLTGDPAEVAATLTAHLRDMHNHLRRRAGRPPFRYD